MPVPTGIVRAATAFGTDRFLSMDHVRWLDEPALRRPIVIAAFTGWNDAGDAASTSVRHLVEAWGAKALADEEHGRLVALALADDDGAVDGQAVQLAAHGVHGGLVGGLLVATATQARRGHGGALGHADEFKRQDALDDLFFLNDEIGHGVPLAWE